MISNIFLNAFSKSHSTIRTNVQGREDIFDYVSVRQTFQPNLTFEIIASLGSD